MLYYNLFQWHSNPPKYSTLPTSLHGRESPLCLPLSPGRILVEVATDPPEVELEARLRMRAAAPLDGVDVVGKVVAENGGPLQEIRILDACLH